MTEVTPGVDGIRTSALHRDWDDAVTADEFLGQTIACFAGHRRFREKRGDLVINGILLVF